MESEPNATEFAAVALPPIAILLAPVAFPKIAAELVSLALEFLPIATEL